MGSNLYPDLRRRLTEADASSCGMERLARDLVQPDQRAQLHSTIRDQKTTTANGILKDAGLPKAS